MLHALRLSDVILAEKLEPDGAFADMSKVFGMVVGTVTVIRLGTGDDQLVIVKTCDDSAMLRTA
jgi:hypothetical protein